MKDYLIDVRIKNNRLMQRILDAGFENAADVARKTEFNNATVYQCLALKYSVYDKKFKLRVFPRRLSEYFLCEPTDLFPEEVWYEALEENHAQLEASGHEIQSLTNQTRGSIEGLEHLIDMEKVGDGLMRVFDKSKEDDARQAAVKKRMADVLRMRYEDEMTLEDTARALDVTRERIRQIEAKALRILRHPTKSEEWREVL